MYLYPLIHHEAHCRPGELKRWRLVLYSLRAGCLGSKSSGWCDVLAVGCVPMASGGVEPARPVYLKTCLVVANSSMRSPVAHACHSIGFVDIRW